MRKKNHIPCEFKDPRLPDFDDRPPLDLSDLTPGRAENALPRQEQPASGQPPAPGPSGLV